MPGEISNFPPLGLIEGGIAPNVIAGGHILDMHFGIIQLIPGQQSLVNVASLYQVTVDAPEPATLFLVLGALGLTGLARRGGGTPVVPLRASALR